jgi:hypothetical protein
MIRNRSAICRASSKTKEYKFNTPIQVLLARVVFDLFFCFSTVPEDGTPVPKHVGVHSYRERYLMISILLYLTEWIC